jgi:4-hydroxyphenylpyruvate dioxygenase
MKSGRSNEMIRSIATVSIGGALDQKLKAIAAAGFDAVEIFENDLTSSSASAREIALMCGDLGLRICALQPFRDFEGLPEPQRRQAFRRAEKKFDLMQELGTDLLLVCSNVSPLALGGIDRAAADLQELGERAASRGLRVGFEALAWSRYINDYRDAWEIVRRANHPAIGVILDSFHTLAPGFPVNAIPAIPGDRIFLVQLADAPQLDLDVLSCSRHFRRFPGQGNLPVTSFMEAVDATGYRGPLSLEVFNDQFRAQSTGDVAIDAMRSLLLLPDERNNDVAAHARTDVSDIAFIEFAVDRAHAAALAGLLGVLGFELTGRHRSKAVERWSQGNVNLLLNSSVDSFAHSHYLTHGSGVCAIGLAVNDVAAMMSRTDVLRAETFRQPVGPGEMTMPAIRAVGGSLLYFLEPSSPNWDVDFVALEGEAKASSGRLTCIDHIAQSIRFGEMLAWEQFYSGMFALQRAPQHEIVDPLGLVTSQVLQNSSGSFRLVLNASTATQTMSSRFVSEFFGAGVQHIAFACDDIFRTVSAARAAGATFLTIPDNYYDDIDSRFELDRRLLDAMKQNGILYDRDDSGEFFQIYTHVFEESVFFEIVQRRGYKGFGAPNAGIRLAAQTREARLRTILRI